MKAWEVGEAETHFGLSKQEKRLTKLRKEYVEIEMDMLCKAK